MNKLILEDELSSVVGTYGKFTNRYMNPPKFQGIKKKGRFLYNNVCVISDGNPLGRFMVPSFASIMRKGLIASTSAFSVYDAIEPYADFDCAACTPADIERLYDTPVADKTAFMLCIDCEKVEAREQWLTTLRRVAAYAGGGKKNMCVVSLLLPEYPAIPDGEINSLSEREFGFFMEKKLQNPTPAQKFFVEIESLCRQLVNEGFPFINISRVDNLFGPDANGIHGFDLAAFIQESFATGQVKVTTEDYKEVISCSYLRDAVNFAVQILYCGRRGHIYNFCSHLTSLANIKTSLHGSFKEKLALTVEAAPVEACSYRCLNTLKFFQCGWSKKKCVPLNAALYRTACNLTGEKHNNQNNIAIYSGKLTRIKDLELMMLKDIDELCEKHGIRYFLCGGTMLGAVRYGHSIPWDDDLDIGMLRKDFDKFRKVSMKEQKDLYNYSSHWNKSGSHYIVDKVRLNGTYFSTRYSSVHEYPDGLFIDVLVYDQTSNIRWVGKLHSRIVHTLSKAIEVRWFNRPRNNPNRRKEMLMLPFLRLLPLGFYHGLYEFILKLYKHKKNAKYVIDSTGKLQKKGPFLMQGLEDVQRVDFDGGFKAPIPADYTNYLTFDYGPNYLPEPPLSKRAAPHNFARIDMGGYIFDTAEGLTYRDVDVRGELFEREE
ncbi:MAG: LicD family protein [Clostridia bacterium]|nr:LicD family protein [Clostridia bacterium]